MKTLPLLALLVLPLASLSAAPDADSLLDWQTLMRPIVPRGYVAPYTATPLTLDGQLSEAAWQNAPWTTDFVDIEGPAKPRPRFRTRAKMLWDEQYLYVGAELEEPHLWAKLTAHDSIIFFDPDFELFIDPDGDTHDYFEFEINALNTGWDLFLPKPYKDGTKADHGFEIVGLRTAVHLRGTLNEPADKDSGWSVEIAIPWKALEAHAHRPLPPKDGDQWRLGFSRVEWQIDSSSGRYEKVPNTAEDNWVWSPQGVIDMHRPERWGYVQFSRQSVPPPFVADPDAPVRDRLQEIYYAQRAFKKQAGHWAATFPELIGLGADPAIADGGALKMTGAGWEASLPGASGVRWQIRDDSRVWKDAAPQAGAGPWWPEAVEKALAEAGANRWELTRALKDVSEARRDGMRFLIENMPTVDLRTISAPYLLETVTLAYDAFSKTPWAGEVPLEVFLNDVLPYASLNESRDAWRPRLRAIAEPLIAGCRTPGEAALALNRRIFETLHVRYSTQRKKPDQSALESMESGVATCSGLSILLVNACRSVGIPARVAGTPMWANLRGNHTWVEVWDNGGWHFTGAAEPDDKGLDRGWFVADAAQAKPESAQHAIYASSFQKTGLSFPLVWDASLDWVPAINVTERYTPASVDAAALTVMPVGGASCEIKTRLLVRVLAGGKRVEAKVTLRDLLGSTELEGKSRGEEADLNNLLPFALPRGRTYTLRVDYGTKSIERSVLTTSGGTEQLLTLSLD